MALVITLTDYYDNELLITHRGRECSCGQIPVDEECLIKIDKVTPKGEGKHKMKVVITAPLSFDIVRGKAKKRNP